MGFFRGHHIEKRYMDYFFHKAPMSDRPPMKSIDNLVYAALDVPPVAMLISWIVEECLLKLIPDTDDRVASESQVLEVERRVLAAVYHALWNLEEELKAEAQAKGPKAPLPDFGVMDSEEEMKHYMAELERELEL